MTGHYSVLVIGGGNGGLSVAGRLRRAGIGSVAVIEPRDRHVFAPLQSHIAGGVARASDAVRPQASVTPRGVDWIRAEVVSVDPDARSVSLASGETVGYDDLVLAPGIRMDWDAVPGLRAAMTEPTGISNYDYGLAAKASPVLRDLRRGTVVFVQPPEPATCGGAAQKPMYLACHWWHARGVRGDIRVIFVTAASTPAGIAEIDRELEGVLARYGIEVRYDSDLIEVDAAAGSLTVGRGGHRETIDYDVLHAVPPQAPSEWIARAGLSDGAGFVDIDPETFRHRRRGEVWALGDAAAVATRRSGGAIRTQAKILAEHLVAARTGRVAASRYDGYTVIPFTVSRRTVVFAEFDRAGRLRPSVPGWRTLYRERRLSYVFDRWILPWVYWNLILRGRA